MVVDPPDGRLPPKPPAGESASTTRLKAPGSLDSRWLTEDVPYGLGAWVSVARQYGVATPVMESLVNLATPVMGFDGWAVGRGVEALGIAGLDKNELAAYLGKG